MNTLSNTLRELWRLSLPMVVSHGAFAAMIFTDRLFMSYLDATHIAAALGGGVAAFFCMSLFIGLIAYGNALVAQYYGAGQFAKCPQVTSQGLLLVLASAPLLLVMTVAGSNAFTWMGHEAEQARLERIYFQVLMAGSLLSLAKASLASYFAGIGRTRVVMVADVLGTAVNIPLSWVLIFGKFGLPALGIAGAGLGSVLATLLSIGIFLRFYLDRAHQRQFSVAAAWRYDRGIMRRYLRLGTPSGLEAFMNTGSFNLFLLLFQSYGVAHGAALAIVFNWDMLSFVPMMGLSIGVTSLIGRSVGAGNLVGANRVIQSGFLIALCYAGPLALFFLGFRHELVAVFATGDAHFATIQPLASAMMVGLVSYMLADATILVSGGVLRGAGDTRWVMVTSITVHWVMLLVQYLVIVVYRLDPLVSWWVFVAMLISLALLYLGRLLGGTWRQPERLARVMSD